MAKSNNFLIVDIFEYIYLLSSKTSKALSVAENGRDKLRVNFQENVAI